MLLVKMKFKSPLHVGSGGWGMEETESIIHSDTLYSALMNASIELSGRPLGEIFISSAFPFAGNRLFFPKPMVKFSSAAQGEGYLRDHIKDLKTLKFVVEPCFRTWLSGEPLDVVTMLDMQKELSEWVKSDVRPRVVLDRKTQASQLYFVGHVSFKEGSGLYCLVDPGPHEDYIRTLFRLLGEQGIGGERSAGYGRFEVEFGHWDIPQVDGSAYVSLSLVNPAPEEHKYLSSYRLVWRTGWVYSPAACDTARRRPVAMVSEGSVFTSKVKGRIVDVTPPGWEGHRVLRHGIAFLVRAGVGV